MRALFLGSFWERYLCSVKETRGRNNALCFASHCHTWVCLRNHSRHWKESSAWSPDCHHWTLPSHMRQISLLCKSIGVGFSGMCSYKDSDTCLKHPVPNGCWSSVERAESLVKLREEMRLSRRRVEGGIRKKFRKEWWDCQEVEEGLGQRGAKGDHLWSGERTSCFSSSLYWLALIVRALQHSPVYFNWTNGSGSGMFTRGGSWISEPTLGIRSVWLFAI